MIVFLALVVGLVAATQAAADPLVDSGRQDWLRRVVPADLAPPGNRAPPIAIIEDGFDTTHPDMQGGWVTQRRFGPEPTTDDELIELALGIAHGTAVAGVIGAPRDGVGLEGVLPGARVWVYGSSGRCYDVAAAIRRAVRDGAKVINVSGGFESGFVCPALRNATSWAFGKGTLIVASAGNLRPKQRWVQPGSDHHVLTVGALNAFDQAASFSQQTIYLDVMAPGEGVLTAWPTVLDVSDGLADGYEVLGGTSFSAPIVAAAAAWILAERPDLTADQLANVIRYSARDLGNPGWDRAYGWGAVDIREALQYPAPTHDYLEPNDEVRWVNGRSAFAADRPLLGRRRAQTVVARLDVGEDPRDFYPLFFPVGGTATITVESRAVAVDLFVWQPSTRYASEPGKLVSRSTRGGNANERVVVTNYGSRRAAFVEVRSRRDDDYGGMYVLRIKRS
jgi:hypothetical protein